VYDFDVMPDRAGTGAMKWQGSRSGFLPMGLADMDFPTAPSIVDALRARVDHGVFGYTEAPVGATHAFVNWASRRHGWAPDPGGIVVSPGVLQSLVMLLRALLEPGQGAIVQTPAFGPIPELIAANGFAVVENPLQLMDGRYELDFGRFEMLAARRDVRAFVLCSPHNPIGRVWSRDELDRLATTCAAHDVTVVSDEIHGEVTFPWSRFVPFGSVARAGSSHAVLTGPSKAFNLPGLRTSLSVIVGDRLRAGFDEERSKVNEDFGVSAPGVVALEAAYRHGGEWLDALISHLAGNLAALESALADSPIRVVRPDATFLTWLDCRGLHLGDDDLAAWFGALAIGLEPGIAFGGEGSGFMRMNIATTRSRVDEAASRIASAVQTG
jgi:cystathionine beta-lyase